MLTIESHAPLDANKASGSNGAAQPANFIIPAAASLQERRLRTLKYGETFGVFDHNGDAYPGNGSPEGLYHLDTRHLAYFSLTIADRRPMLLSSTPRDDNAALLFDLTNPDLYDERGEIALEHDLIHIRRVRFLWGGACYERLSVRNYDVKPLRIRLGMDFFADFADIFEVRGHKRPARGVSHPPEIHDDRVILGYTGLDELTRRTMLRFEPAPKELDGGHAEFELELKPLKSRLLFVEIRCDQGDCSTSVRRQFLNALRDARRSLRDSSARSVSIVASNEIFNELLRRSVADLNMLACETPQGLYPHAGIPWFSTAFGRDGLITALETLWLNPSVARGVLGYLAVHQATESNAAADSEPGKILHEARDGEMARLGEVPFHRYYGSVDSTPLFVMLAGAYLKRTGDMDTIRALAPNIQAALHWIEAYGDRDDDGFVEYGRRTAEGLANQGWKDSCDSIFHADGELARGPIALVELQAYVYGAWRAAADIARADNRPRDEQAWRDKAEALRRRFDEAFFDESLGGYVLALDGDKRPCRVRSSNAGHALYTGIAYPERAGAVVATLMDPTSFSGWGVRTIATTESRYNPMSYHNGSIWPHDNAIIAAGFARYGFRREAARVFEGVNAASTYIDLRRLPELFCGFPRQRNQGPTLYPVACTPQAWAAAAPLSMLQSCLRLGFDERNRQISFGHPILPQFLDEVVLRGLSVGKASIDVALKRVGDEVLVNVLTRRGGVEVVSMA
jgi:glycogen debranching enzyme